MIFVNGFGAVFESQFGFFVIAFTEGLLLFLAIYGFTKVIGMIFKFL